MTYWLKCVRRLCWIIASIARLLVDEVLRSEAVKPSTEKLSSRQYDEELRRWSGEEGRGLRTRWRGWEGEGVRWREGGVVRWRWGGEMDRGVKWWGEGDEWVRWCEGEGGKVVSEGDKAGWGGKVNYRAEFQHRPLGGASWAELQQQTVSSRRSARLQHTGERPFRA